MSELPARRRPLLYPATRVGPVLPREHRRAQTQMVSAISIEFSARSQGSLQRRRDDGFKRSADIGDGAGDDPVGAVQA